MAAYCQVVLSLLTGAGDAVGFLFDMTQSPISMNHGCLPDHP